MITSAAAAHPSPVAIIHWDNISINRLCYRCQWTYSQLREAIELRKQKTGGGLCEAPFLALIIQRTLWLLILKEKKRKSASSPIIHGGLDIQIPRPGRWSVTQCINRRCWNFLTKICGTADNLQKKTQRLGRWRKESTHNDNRRDDVSGHCFHRV